jgi:hypothetical protein
MKIKLKKQNITSHKLSPQEFCSKYLPQSWCERDLQMYVQRLIKIRQGAGLFTPPDEVVVKTPNSRRRIDLATWFEVYEIKCWLTYDNIYHAVGQSEIYARYGGKILWLIKKRRVIIGVAPTDSKEYESASRLAKDFSNLRGIKVIFINEHPEWHLMRAESFNINKYLLFVIYFMGLFIIGFAITVLIIK